MVNRSALNTEIASRASAWLVICRWAEYIFESSMPAPFSCLCKGCCLGLMKLTTYLQLNFQPPAPQCTREALGGLCHHCQALVFAALPMGHLEDFLTLLWDLIRDPTQIHIVMVYSLDTALRSS